MAHIEEFANCCGALELGSVDYMFRDWNLPRDETPPTVDALCADYERQLQLHQAMHHDFGLVIATTSTGNKPTAIEALKQWGMEPVVKFFNPNSENTCTLWVKTINQPVKEKSSAKKVQK